MVLHDWDEVLEAQGSNAKAAAYQKYLEAAMDVFFPYKTTARNSNDSPWINAGIKRRIRQRHGIYQREGRSAKWKCLKKVTDTIIRKRRKVYMDSQRDDLLQDDGDRCFFKNIKSYRTKEKPRQFDIRQLIPELSNKKCAEWVADHFNAISHEFQPLEPSQIPMT